MFKLLKYLYAIVAIGSILTDSFLLIRKLPPLNYTLTARKFVNRGVYYVGNTRHNKPDFSKHFEHQYKHHEKLLEIAAPCTFQPCGANAHCDANYGHLTRVCHCNENFVPHPLYPEACIRPCDDHNCGDDAFCINEGNKPVCICKPGYLPLPSSTDSNFVGCIDVCESRPCTEKNTLCIPKSSMERDCYCKEGTIAIDQNAEKNGCAIDPCVTTPCDSTNTICKPISATDRTCLCSQGTVPHPDGVETYGCITPSCTGPNAPVCGGNSFCAFVNGEEVCLCKNGYYRGGVIEIVNGVGEDEIDGEGEVNGVRGGEVNGGVERDVNGVGAGEGECIPTPCSTPNECGPGAICILGPGFSKKCVCPPGYFLDDSDECKNPCDGMPCTLLNSACAPLSATDYKCTCFAGFIYIDDHNEALGCQIKCGTSTTATYIPSTGYCLEVFKDDQKSWSAARTACQNLGGDLAVFFFDEYDIDYDVLRGFLDDNDLDAHSVQGDNPWIGAGPLDGEYKWVDPSSTLIPIADPIWRRVTLEGEPAETFGTDEAVTLWLQVAGQFYLNDEPDHQLRPYICQFFGPW